MEQYSDHAAVHVDDEVDDGHVRQSPARGKAEEPSGPVHHFDCCPIPSFATWSENSSRLSIKRLTLESDSGKSVSTHPGKPAEKTVVRLYSCRGCVCVLQCHVNSVLRHPIAPTAQSSVTPPYPSPLPNSLQIHINSQWTKPLRTSAQTRPSSPPCNVQSASNSSQSRFTSATADTPSAVCVRRNHKSVRLAGTTSVVNCETTI